MKLIREILFVVAGFLLISKTQARTEVLINIDRGRSAGGTQVFQRAILSKSNLPTRTVLLMFRGIPEGGPLRRGGHLHSHQQGGEKVVAKAIIAWIKTKKVETLIRE